MYGRQRSKTSTDFNRLLTGEIQSLGRGYLGGYLGYDITLLLRWDNYLIQNLDDHSRFFSPNLVFSLTDNVELKLGAQVFHGNPGTEYGTFKDLYFTQLQWFF